jgi:hypothetical protein
MEFFVKKTTELTAKESDAILLLFNDVFQVNRTLSEFLNQYRNNVLGFSYHSLILDKGEIVGANAFVTGYYLIDEQKSLFVVSIDTMIRKSHRGIENFYNLIHVAYERLSQDGVAFVLGFPNDNSFPVFTATDLLLEIGRLNTYCLPVNVGGIDRRFRFMNILSNAFSRCWLGAASIFASAKVYSSRIRKETESYNHFRYKRMDGEYQRVNLPGLEFFYKVKTIEGIRTATLIDVTQKSSKNFCRAVRYILKNEKHNFDLLLYVGHLPFSINGMIQVPKKLEPKKFHFNGCWIGKNNQPDTKLIFNLENWDINLSDFDII